MVALRFIALAGTTPQIHPRRRCRSGKGETQHMVQIRSLVGLLPAGGSLTLFSLAHGRGARRLRRFTLRNPAGQSIRPCLLGRCSGLKSSQPAPLHTAQGASGAHWADLSSNFAWSCSGMSRLNRQDRREMVFWMPWSGAPALPDSAMHETISITFIPLILSPIPPCICRKKCTKNPSQPGILMVCS